MELLLYFLCVNGKFQRELPAFLFYQAVGVQKSKLFNVDWPFLFVNAMKTALIVFEDSLNINFISLKPRHDRIYLVFIAPFNHILKHQFYLLNVKLSCPTIPKQIIVVPVSIRIKVVIINPLS